MKYPKRNPDNGNQRLHHDSVYNGRSVFTARGPLIVQYLSGLEHCIECALEDYPEVFVQRLELMLPQDNLNEPERLIERFFSSLRSKIDASQRQSRDFGKRAHSTKVRYVWCREFSTTGKPHYHVAILLNKQSYWRLGDYDFNRGNLYSMIVEAWLSALRLPRVDHYVPLVHITQRGSYLMRRDDPEAIDCVFNRLSYLCKADTKKFGSYRHNFGYSRQ